MSRDSPSDVPVSAEHPIVEGVAGDVNSRDIRLRETQSIDTIQESGVGAGNAAPEAVVKGGVDSIEPATAGSVGNDLLIKQDTTAAKAVFPSTSTDPSISTVEPSSISTPSPLRNRNLRPKKSILKPPPPPIKPGISGKLRDALGSIHPKFYDYTAPLSSTSEWANGVAGNIAGSNAVAGLSQGLTLTEGGTVQSVANNVIGVGEVVGGAAVAMVGSLGGRLGRFMGGATGKKVMDATSGVAASSAYALDVPEKSQYPSDKSIQPNASNSSSSPLRSISITTNPATASLVSPSPSTSSTNNKPLKRATFILPLISTTYPISASQAPYSSKVLSEKEKIDKDKTEEIGRCRGEEWWNRERLTALYEAACAGREETVRVALRDGLIAASPQPSTTSSFTPSRQLLLTSSLALAPSSTLHTANPKSYFIIDPPLGRYAAEALADVLRVEWGLKKLVLEGGVIDGDESLKPILHALLVSGTLPHLSLAGNRKVKAAGWRATAHYIKRAKSLRYIDLSDNILDRRSIEGLVAALSPQRCSEEEGVGYAEESSAAEKTGAAEAGAADQTVIGVVGQSAPQLREPGPSSSTRAPLQTLRMDNCSLRAASLEALGQGIRHSDVKNLSLRKNKINSMGGVAIAIMIRDFPDSASTMTSRQVSSQQQQGVNSVLFSSDSPTEPGSPSTGAVKQSMNGNDRIQQDLVAATDILHSHDKSETSASVALQQKVKETEKVERLGSLVTLDVKSNDIRGGVSYIAQVLKRNRTLKVLNISDNRIDATGLVAIADALKYNSTLETLDLSQNPCCGPSTDGVAAIRSMLTVNSTLKRLFLSSTGLTTEGAIALAEVVPDCRGIIHLDLTNNPNIELAGMMAISAALRSNKTMRCLDLTIPSNDPQMAELSQSILQSCIRNTENAAASKGGNSTTNPSAAAVWAPIQKSSLVRQAKEAEQAKAFAETQKAAITPAGHARQDVYKLKPDAVLKACEEIVQVLMQYVEKGVGEEGELTPLKEQEEALMIERSKALMERVAELIQVTGDAEKLERLLALNDLLQPQTAQAEEVLEKRKRKAAEKATRPVVTINHNVPRIQNPSSATSTPTRSIPQGQARRHIRVPSLELTSPNFSITNSDDDDSDAEELSATVPTPDMTTQSFTIKGQSPSNSSRFPGHRLSLGGLGMEPKVSSSSPIIDEPEGSSSPLKEVNRDWMAEEGEIFRKGAKLGVADEDEDEEDADISGQDLKQKILDAEVPRSPHAPIPDDMKSSNDSHHDEV